jgi:ribosomal protein S18 acetylase RimI-like enzyme
MLLREAAEADYDEIIDLANWAYRGREGAVPSWNIETGIVGGQRMDASLLREELAAKRDGALLTYRESAEGPLLGTAWLNPEQDEAWYLGLLTVRPDMQGRGLGHKFLAAAEEFAKQRGARRIRITVLHVRYALIAWYERRGYQATGETEPFPYGDPRFGRPERDDLHFLVFEKTIQE